MEMILLEGTGYDTTNRCTRVDVRGVCAGCAVSMSSRGSVEIKQVIASRKMVVIVGCKLSVRGLKR